RFFVVAGGKGSFVRGGGGGGCHYEARKGDVFVFNSDEIHSCIKTYPGYKSYCLQFLPSYLSSKFVDICESKYIKPLTEKRIYFKNCYKEADTLRSIFTLCERADQNRYEGYQIALKGYLYAFLSELYKLNPHLSTIPDHDDTHPNFERVNTVINYIANHYTEKIDFKEIVSSLIHLDYSYFSRIFKSQTGKTLLQYLNEYRLTVALNQLSTINRNITDIALSCGFDDLNYFSRSFKQLIGLSPSAVKKARWRE
ncbi:MAG: AraC family transcriptional regulator, partial [Firmicutes bacterium]|nr:AraC family transcriptional regulator [Bacillota bacterium]